MVAEDGGGREAGHGPDGFDAPTADPIDFPSEDGADEDPGFLGQVAHAVGDLWDDAPGGVS